MAAPRLLVVRTYWHPGSTPGARRLECFCRHLAEDGWDVTLVALQPPAARPGKDPDPLPDVPYRRILLPHSIRPGTLAAGLEHRLRKWFPGLFMDGYAEARCRVFREASAHLAETHFDLLLATFPFAASLQVADRLHRRYGVPWVADLRDLPDEFDPERRRWATRRSAERVGRWCRGAACVVTVSDPLQAALQTRYGLGAVPVEVVHNGFDEQAFEGVPMPETSETFDVAYCGGARRGDGRSATLLREGLLELHRRGADLAGVRIVLVGPNNAESLGLGAESRLPVPVVRMGMVPHSAALAAMRSSAILLSLASPGAKGILTSKVFEYAKAGRPVLGIPRDRDALDEFISRSKIGQSCDHPNDVADFLAGHLESWRRTGRLPESGAEASFLDGFSRRSQSLRLSGILRQCI